MRPISCYLIVSLALAVSCGGDDDNATSTGSATTGGSGGSGSGAAGGTGGALGEAGSAGAASPNVMCNPNGTGVCQNQDDCPAVEDGSARTSSQVCGVNCLEDEDPGVCSVACIVDQADISSTCAQCYAGVVACATQNCLSECVADAASDACSACQVTAGCREEFSECSGLPQ
jgi:hypothetical protein